MVKVSVSLKCFGGATSSDMTEKNRRKSVTLRSHYVRVLSLNFYVSAFPASMYSN